MNTKTINKITKKPPEAMLNIPLSALRYLFKYPRKNKIVIEIGIEDIKRVNSAKTIDEIINEARMDYAKGNFTSHKTAKSLIAALES